MISFKSKRIGYYLVFLFWPFGALGLALKKFRSPIGRILFVLIISFLGYTAASEGDLKRYEGLFYASQDASILELLKSYVEFKNADIYVNLLANLSSHVFRSHHAFFAILFGVFAYFYSGVLLNILKMKPRQFTIKLLILFLGFALYYSIRSIISIRFYTGALFFLYLMTSYILTNDKKFLYLTLLSPLFHFALAVILIIVPMFLLFNRRPLIVLLMLIISFAINESAVIANFESLALLNRDTVVESRINTYASAKGKARLDERYAQGYLKYNWKMKALGLLGDSIFYLANISIFLIFFLKRNFINDRTLRSMFILSMLVLSVTNIMLNISNGNRFSVIFIFTFLGLSYLLSCSGVFKGVVKYLLYSLNLMGLIYGIASLYAANPLFNYRFFLLNYFIVPLVSN